jgi:hypothetical protein
MSNNIYIVSGNIPVHLTKFERNFTKRNFYFAMRFMSKRNFYFETEGVWGKKHAPHTCINYVRTQDKLEIQTSMLGYLIFLQRIDKNLMNANSNVMVS